MTLILTPSLTISSGTKVRRIRELPVPGTLRRREGDPVSADEIVAQTELPGELLIVRVSEQLGIEPFEVLSGMQVRVGDVVEKGALLCVHAGLFGLLKARLFSPVSGTVEFIAERTGHVGIREVARQIAVRAYVSGVVVATTPGKSVTIESNAAFIQGIFGIGGERRGSLSILPIDGGVSVTPDHLPNDCTGAVLVGGTAPTLTALHEAARRGAVGFVCGAIDDTVLKGYLGHDLGVAVTGDEAVPMTLIITEGFGRIPISERIMAVLKPLHGRSASINGATQVRAGAVRPEIIVPVDSHVEDIGGGGSGLDLGRKVRLIRFPYFGERGEVVDLPPDPVKIETGAMARVLRAKLDDGRVVTVPRSNVELL